MDRTRSKEYAATQHRGFAGRCACFLFLTLVASGFASAQELTCRALPAGAAAPLLGHVEAWPALVDDLFLGRLLYADLLSDGSAVVLDRAKAELVRVDRRDGRVTTLARKGQGPGEIGTVAGMVVTPGNVIVVLDRAKRKLVRLTQQGKLVSTTDYEPLGLPAFIGTRGSDVIEVSRQRPQAGTAEPIVMTVRLFGSESTRVLRKGQLRDAASEPGILTPIGFGDLIQGSRLVMASGVSEDVTVLSLDGGRDSVVHLAIGPPRRATREFVEQILFLALPQFPQDERRRVIANILGSNPIVPYYPMFSRLVMGASGGWWAQRTYMGDGGSTPVEAPPGLSMDDLGGPVWLQFAPGGTASAECRSPADWRVLLARGGTVVFAMDDASSTRFFTWRPR